MMTQKLEIAEMTHNFWVQKKMKSRKVRQQKRIKIFVTKEELDQSREKFTNINEGKGRKLVEEISKSTNKQL